MILWALEYSLNSLEFRSLLFSGVYTYISFWPLILPVFPGSNSCLYYTLSTSGCIFFVWILDCSLVWKKLSSSKWIVGGGPWLFRIPNLSSSDVTRLLFIMVCLSGSHILYPLVFVLYPTGAPFFVQSWNLLCFCEGMWTKAKHPNIFMC